MLMTTTTVAATNITNTGSATVVSHPGGDLNAYLKTYNQDRPHQGRGMNGRTPAKAFTDGLPNPTKSTKMRKTETKKAA